MTTVGSRGSPTWHEHASVFRPRSAAFLLLAGLAALGLAGTVLGVVAASRSPVASATVVSIVVLALYAFPFLLVISRADLFEREPLGLALAAFLWGAFAATLVAGIANTALLDTITKLADPSFAERWGPAIVAPTTEEPLKALAVLLLVIIAAVEIDSPLDGLVYGALAGLGFQLLENLQYFVAAAQQVPEYQIEVVVQMFTVRGIFGGLWTHAAWTGLVGYGIGYAVSRSDASREKRILIAVTTFAAAWLLHFSWNSPWMEGGDWGSGVVMVLVKGIPGLVLLLVVYQLARRHEASWVKAALAPEVEGGVVSAAEVESLLTLKARRAARKAERRRTGRAGSSAVKRLQRAAIALALGLTRREAPADELDRLRTNVDAARAQLRTLQAAPAAP